MIREIRRLHQNHFCAPTYKAAMPDFLIQSDERLDLFLRRNRVMQWRIPILIKNGGVKVLEARTRRTLPLDGMKTRVGPGDTVRVVTPPPKLCAEALQKEAN